MSEIGFIGLGKMGKGMVIKLLSEGFDVVGYDIDKKARDTVASYGVKTVSTLEGLVKDLDKPRKIILMVPAGRAIDDIISQLLPQLQNGDIVVDSGNSNYKDTLRRAKELIDENIFFLDVGTSGGLEGAIKGLSLVVGGNTEAYEKMLPIFNGISVEDGVRYVGKSGSGHYVKMVHNAIEYGILQAYAEGFELLSEAPYDFDLAEISKVWNNGSLIRSWILELIQRIFENDEDLTSITGYVGGGETGRWAIEEAWDRGVPLTIISTALILRHLSRRKDSFSNKLLASLRKEFGGHEVIKK